MVSTRNMRSTPSKRTRSRNASLDPTTTRPTRRRRKMDVVDESNKMPEEQKKERICEESSQHVVLGETLLQEEEIEPPLPILNRVSDSLLDVVESVKKTSTNSTLFAFLTTKSGDDVDDYLHKEYGKGYYEEDESEEEEFDAKPLPSSSLTYGVSQNLIGMGLGWMYFLAFYGAYRQNEGLMGSRGLVPTKPWIDSVHNRYGCPSSLGIFKWWNSNCYSGFMGLPSVFWWIDFNDTTMNALLLVGTTLSLSCGLGKSNNMAVWLLLWILYFSVVTAASTTSFYQYGWESQLLETGVLCAFLCQQLWPKIQDLHGILPKSLAPTTQSKTEQEQPASPLVLWLFRWLCFRISIGAGMIKIRGDSCWTQKTCLLYHFETQPIPSPLSFVFHFLPDWMLKQAVNLDLFVQVYTSWFVVLPATRLLSNYRWFRGNPYFERVEEISLTLVRLGGWIQIGFMVNIALSGNLSMLNHLTILPALACLDDACYPVWVQDLVLNGHWPAELSTIISKILERMDNNSDNTPSLSANTPSLSANHSGEETGEESELAIETENLDPVDAYADMDAIQTPVKVHETVSNTGIYPVGTRTKRFFDEVSAWYQGTIRSYNPDTQFYTIEYEDGDEEELEHKEIDTGSMPPHKYEIGNVFTVYLVQEENGQNEQQNIERATMTIVSKFLFKPLRGKREWKYSVDYSNGDSEDLSESDITQCVRLAAEKHNDDASPRSASSQGFQDQGFEEKFESQPETVEEPVEEPVEETKKITVDGITDKSLTSLFLSSSQNGEIDATKPLSSLLLDTLLGRHIVPQSSSRCYQWNWNKPRVWVDILLVLTILILSVPVMENLLEIGGSHQKMNASFGSFRLVNTYGAFGSVGKERYEPIISIAYAPARKSDPLEWIEIEFPCKPGSVDRRPCFCAPYHYRLDWNIWFIGFKPHAQMLNQRESWMYQLLEKILEKDNDAGSKGWISNRRAKPWLNLLDTTSSGLLEERGAPTYAKVDMYRYEMAAPLWRLLPRYLVSFLAGNPVQWWDRSFEEELLPVITLDSKGKLTKARIPYW